MNQRNSSRRKAPNYSKLGGKFPIQKNRELDLDCREFSGFNRERIGSDQAAGDYRPLNRANRS